MLVLLVFEVMEAAGAGVDSDPRQTIAIDVAASGAIRVRRGSYMITIDVGGEADKKSWGLCPPAQGDCWELDLECESGAYDIVFVGGGNPYHGIFTVEVDGCVLGEVDQWEPRTTFPTEHALYWEGGERGIHTLRVTVANKRRESHDYWCCVHEILLSPVAMRHCQVITVHASRWLLDPAGLLSISCMSIGGSEIASFQLSPDAKLGKLHEMIVQEMEDVASVKLLLPNGTLLVEDDSDSALAAVLFSEVHE